MKRLDRSQSSHSSGEAVQPNAGSEGEQGGRCERTQSRKRNPAKRRNYTPATGPFTAIPAGEPPGIEPWAHRAVWTERMLETLLEKKVRGGKGRWPNAFFRDHGFTSLNDAPIRFVQSTGTY